MVIKILKLEKENIKDYKKIYLSNLKREYDSLKS
jgi:hypothetical protein